MSDDLRDATPMAAATGPCDTSASTHPPASMATLAPTPQAMAPTPPPTSQAMAPTRVRSLAPLLMRENVKAIIGLSAIKSLRIQVEFSDGTSDSKSISLATDGSAALILLDDNPDGIPSGAFYDIRP
jgi:hypothetical protein